MKSFKKMASLGVLAALGLSAPAYALPSSATEVSDNITTDTTWTKEMSPVILRETIFVTGGASLTIEAGVTIITFIEDDGGLVVERDGQIFALGTADQPIIMTSAADVATWDGSDVTTGPVDTDGDGVDDDTGVTDISVVGDPTTGEWRETIQEWRNLTILGNAVISASEFGGNPVEGSDGIDNPATPDGTADKQMEGLQVGEGSGGDSVYYGGDDDDDDSGTLNYVSVRYGGRVLGEGNELNGMSLGGLGRGTDLDYIEIMNNVDDGIEIWGGTANLSHFQIWNIGDDSLDFDQGWRGKAQFGLIVQGYSAANEQGSGVGDNAIEHDGAEQSDAQPRSTVALYNMTVIGQPGGDGLTAWRDNARIQYHKSVFMSAGESLVRLDDSDGDGGEGYGFNGTHEWADVWQTAETNVSPNGVNDGSGDFSPANLYAAHQSDGVDGNLAMIEDSVFYDIDTFYTNQSHLGTPRGGDFDPSTLFDPAQNGSTNNVVADLADLPIQSITRDSLQTVGPDNVAIARVIELDPRAANDATNSAGDLPAQDGFWTQADYRGAFSEAHNWAAGWSAADAYGFYPGDQTADDPEVSFEVQVTTTTFQTEVGESYVIESSTDGRDWNPVATVEGDGTLKTVANEISVDESKIYRVRVQ